jgi:hypothetical protein
MSKHNINVLEWLMLETRQKYDLDIKMRICNNFAVYVLKILYIVKKIVLKMQFYKSKDLEQEFYVF